MKLLSIVIPTRNREEYCISAIRQILAYDRDDFELCICDNSDSDIVENFVSDREDNRLVYIHIKGRINSAINMDSAMRMASGEYVCMIGDDDAILPSIFNLAKWAKDNDYDNVTPAKILNYYWPDDTGRSGYLEWYDIENVKPIYRESQKELDRFVRNGLIRYSDYLPRAYHGLAKRNLLVSVLNKTGHMIGGLSPDIYMATTLACLSKSFVVVEQPFTIAGACPKSYTSRDKRKKNVLGLESNPQFYKRGIYVWDERIPKITTSETIWAETAIKALEEMDFSEKLLVFNQGFLFGEILFWNRKYLTKVIISLKDAKYTNSVVLVIWDILRFLVSKAIGRMFRKRLIKNKIENLCNMDEAIIKYLDYCN